MKTFPNLKSTDKEWPFTGSVWSYFIISCLHEKNSIYCSPSNRSETASLHKNTSKEQSKIQLNKRPASSQTPQTSCSFTLKTHAALTSKWSVIFSTPTGHSGNLTQLVDSTHHWLGRLCVSRVLLLLGCRSGRIGSLGLGGRWAAVWHGQLPQVGGFWWKHWGALATVQACFSWKGQT